MSELVLNQNSGKDTGSFLHKISPFKVVIFSFAVWCLLFFTAPLNINISLNLDAYLFIFFSFVCFFLGGFICPKPQNEHIESTAINSKAFNFKIYNLLIVIASAGLILKITDSIFLRGLSFNRDYLDNREISGASSGNALSICADFLLPFCYFPVFYLLKYKFKISVFKKILTYGLFFGQVFDSFMLGSRSALFILAVFLVLYLLYFKKIRFKLKSIIIGVFVFLGLITLMSFIFLQRTKSFAGDNVYDLLLYGSNFNYTISPNQSFTNFFHTASESLKPTFITYITTCQYFTHGMFEFSYLYDKFSSDNYSYGAYTFLVFYRFVMMVGGVNDVDMNHLINLAPRTGVYTTLFGPLFIDFGWLTLLFMFFFGYFTYHIYYKAIKGIDWATMLYFYIFSVLAFWPIFNFINGAGGIFIFVALIILSIIIKAKYYLR